VMTIGKLSGVFWALCVGAVALFAFFLALQAFSPNDVWGLTVAVAIVAVMCLVHFMRVARVLDDHDQDEFRRMVNGFRERRGF
jgi:cobalamin biosynthesis protein CobD/CbiB